MFKRKLIYALLIGLLITAQTSVSANNESSQPASETSQNALKKVLNKIQSVKNNHPIMIKCALPVSGIMAVAGFYFRRQAKRYEEEIRIIVCTEQTAAVMLAQRNQQREDNEIKKGLQKRKWTLSAFVPRFLKKECPLCCDKKMGLVSLSCGHKTTCTKCLQFIVKTGFIEKNVAECKCPDCKVVFSEQDLKKMGYDKTIVKLYLDKLHEQQLLTDPEIRHCPTRDCNNMFKPTQGQEYVNCKRCGGHYCAHCLLNHPKSVSCKIAGKMKAQSETTPLNNLNIKQCPQCKFGIERIDGCNHIKCKCGYAFCWNCLKKSDHTGKCCGVLWPWQQDR